jgi:hypothetical protein
MRELITRINAALRFVEVHLTVSTAKDKRPALLLWHELRAQNLRDSFTPLAYSFANFLAGPCAEKVQLCERCRKFFLQTTGHLNKKYCSRACAVFYAATRATKAKRLAVKKEKLASVLKAYAVFARRKRMENWKPSLCRAAKVDVRFLTRAIHQGHLPPTPWPA